MRQDFPLDVELTERFLADVLALGHDDDGHLAALLVGDIVEPGPGRAPVLGKALEVYDIFVFPGQNVSHAGKSSGFRGVYAQHLRVGVGAAEEFGVEHARDNVVDAELRDA